MVSLIIKDATAMTNIPPTTAMVDVADAPKSILTLATETAPSGRIIDDSARGTIFWEADISNKDEEAVPAAGTIAAKAVDNGSSMPARTWGTPFRIEWISTSRLPFRRTRHLRNPWNANREVRIARDGTDLEPSVGKRLVQMFYPEGPPRVSPLV